MRWYWVLLIVLAILFLLGQIRVGGGAEFNALGFFAWVRVGPLNIRVFPLKKKRGGGQKKPKKKKEKPPKPAVEKPKEPAMEKLGGAVDYALALLPIALDAAAQFGRKLQIDVLRLELTAGAADPADAAVRYGQAVAALGAFWGPLTHAFHVKDGEARALVDFGCERLTIYGSAALSWKLGQLLRLGLWAGWRALWAFLRVRRGRKEKKKENFSVRV